MPAKKTVAKRKSPAQNWSLLGQNARLGEIGLEAGGAPGVEGSQAVDAYKESCCRYDEVVSGRMYYNRYRYYDPHSGRFISKDPIGLEGGINLQQYAPNPTRWIDPLGLKKKDCPLTAVECQKLKEKIERKALGRKSTHGDRGLQERVEHLREDSNSLYYDHYKVNSSKPGEAAYGKGTYYGHIQAAEDLKGGLNKDIGKFHSGGCRGHASISSEAMAVASTPVPEKPDRRR